MAVLTLGWCLPVVTVVMLLLVCVDGCPNGKGVCVEERYCLKKPGTKKSMHRCQLEGTQHQRGVCCDKRETTMYEKCSMAWGNQGRCVPEDQCNGLKRGKNFGKSSCGKESSSGVCYQEKHVKYYCCPDILRQNDLTLPAGKTRDSFNDNAYPPCATWRNAPGRCVPLSLCDDINSWRKRNHYTSYEDLPYKFKCRSSDATDSTAVCCPLPATAEEQLELIRHKKVTKRLMLDECGRVALQNRMVGGSKAELGQYPWMANLLYEKLKNGTWTKVPECGGSLIHQRYVLTAAHCSKPGVKPIAVRLGEYDLRTSRDCTDLRCYESKEYPIQKFIHHEKYTPGGRQYDIALVQLTQEVTIIPDQISPICLPITKQWLMTKPAELILTGWGITEKNWRPSNVLLQATLIIDSNKVCHLEQMICARGSRMEGSCKGDSGGPWQQIRRYGKTFRVVLFGVNSGGACTCSVQDDAPSVMVSVGYHMDWILDNMDI